MILLLSVASALAGQDAIPIEILLIPQDDHVQVDVRAPGQAVALPSCRAVGWERFDDDSKGYLPITGSPCGPMAPATWLTGDGISVTYAPTTPGFQVVRPVVVYGVGCRQGLPLALADCDSIEVMRGPSATLQVPDRSKDR